MQKYNVDKVLKELKLEIALETGDERYLNCPFHRDSDPSFSVNARTGMWICFAGCGQGNLVQLVSRQLDLSYWEAKKWIEGYKEIASVSLLKQKLDNIDKEQGQKRESCTFWSDSMLRPFYNGKMTSYIFKRGFSKEILKEFGIGYDRQTKDIIIPARDENGRLLGIIRRSTTGGVRYINSMGLQKKSFLFGLNRVIIDTGKPDRVFVGEGPLDIIWLAQAGLPAVGLLGSGMTDQQAELLVKNFGTVIMVLDNDDAGREGLEIARRKLLGKVVLLKGVIPAEYKDVQDMSLEELSRIRITGARGN